MADIAIVDADGKPLAAYANVAVMVDGGQPLVTYSVSDAKIAELREAYTGLTADTSEGYEKVRVAIGVLRTTRSAIEARRVDLKADALTWGRKVDGEAKRLTGLLAAIEDPLKVKKDAVDAEKARLKAEKEAAERAVIEAELLAKREAEEREAKARRDAEDAAAKAIRDEEEKHLAEERARLQAERAKMDAERKALEALQQQAAAAQRKEREALDAERLRLDACREAAEWAEAERLAEIQDQKAVAVKAEQEQFAAALAADAKAKMMPDLEKVEIFLGSLHTMTIPAVTSPELAELLEATRRSIALVADDLSTALTQKGWK